MAKQQQSGGTPTGGEREKNSTDRVSTGAGGRPGSFTDQERQRPVSREGGQGDTSAGGQSQAGRQGGTQTGAQTGMHTGAQTGMQRGNSQRTGLGTPGAGHAQPSMLPAFMASPGLMASAFMSNPFAFAQAMSQEMDRLFDTVGGAGGATIGSGDPHMNRGSAAGASMRGSHHPAMRSGTEGRGLQHWSPQMEVSQRGNELVVSADLPGVSPEEVHIDIEDGMLTISGERRQQHETREEGFHRTERMYGSFTRSIALPEGVDEEQVRARFENGVLEVTMPVPQQRQRGRRIQISR
ncbi:MAG: Hsp20/alpha crystallin family protein [Gemmatimonadota bacterium]